jgi:ribosomal protein S17
MGSKNKLLSIIKDKQPLIIQGVIKEVRANQLIVNVSYSKSLTKYKSKKVKDKKYRVVKKEKTYFEGQPIKIISTRKYSPQKNFIEYER